MGNTREIKTNCLFATPKTRCRISHPFLISLKTVTRGNCIKDELVSGFFCNNLDEVFNQTSCLNESSRQQWKLQRSVMMRESQPSPLYNIAAVPCEQ